VWPVWPTQCVGSDGGFSFGLLEADGFGFFYFRSRTRVFGVIE
jgi:hypothetical protein